MSSHDCRITGLILIKVQVTEVAIIAALESFLSHCGRDYEDECSRGNIACEDNTLYLNLGCYGNGGYENPYVGNLARRLNALVAGPCWFEFFDFDTGDMDASCTPYFLGTDQDRSTARLQYGINRMADWVEPIIGKDAFKKIERRILALSRLPTPLAPDLPQPPPAS